ncbi:MAG: hypothetical protein ACRDLN_16300 [Solirubrobacteraceae bacterium]
MIASIRRGKSFAAPILIAALAALVLQIGAPDAQAASYATCRLSEHDQDPPGEKPTYNLSLKRQRTSCATARKVMHAFHKCRPKTGYRCTRKILSRWTCTGRKDSSTALILYASFTCKWGARRVRSSFQQNT